MADERTPAWALAGVLAAALAIRLLGQGRVFVGDDVFFTFGDPYYHLRLAEWSLLHFPRFLVFDPYLNFPDGARVPWPPLYDLWVAASARLAGGSVRALEVWAALWPPLLGTANTALVFALGRRVFGARVGLAAAALFALLPASISLSRVGYADHHAAVADAATAWLWLQTAWLVPEGPVPGAGRRAGRVAGLALARGAVVLTWPGSLLYLALADGAFGLVASAAGRRDGLRAQAASLVATGALLTPVAAVAPAGLGGAFSAIGFSWLHVAACAALALWSALCARFAAGGRVAPSLARALALALPPVALLVAMPFVRAGLGEALVFMGKTDLWSSANPEQAPLFARHGDATWAVVSFGATLPLLALAPCLLAWRAVREPGSPARVLVAAWLVVLGVLALGQVRFVNDLAPTASIGIACVGLWLLDLARRRVRALRGAPGVALAGLLALALLWPGLVRGPLGRLRGADAAAPRAAAAGDAALASIEGSLVRFLETVRDVTPETPGFTDRVPPAPAYAIVSDPSLGHMIHYVARRATPSDNFGPYLSADRLLESLQVLLGTDPDAVGALMERLGARYLLTNWQPAYPPASMLQRLHGDDGKGLGRFRLVAEGPAGGLPLAALFAPVPERAVAYKLFERVAGAVLEVEAAPGAAVTVSLAVETAAGRSFRFHRRAEADAAGVARIRVPYATGVRGEVSTPDAYRVRVGGGLREASVDEADVRSGATLRLRAPGGVAPSP